MLKFAVPNKGSLNTQSLDFLNKASYKVRKNTKKLVVQDTENNIEFYYLRPNDIVSYVAKGVLDAGIVGRDMLLNSPYPANEFLTLGFAKSTFRLASKSVPDTLDNKRFATSYPKLLSDYLDSKNVKNFEIIYLEGAVESAIQLGIADIIADVVSTGATLIEAGLTVFGEVICESEAVIITKPDSQNENLRDELKTLASRFTGIINANEYVLVDYDIEEKYQVEAEKIASGLESPTVSHLSKPGWLAVRVMVPRNKANKIIDDLASVNAKAIIVTQLLNTRF
jgi:ATP phosphoribosyltransferase